MIDEAEHHDKREREQRQHGFDAANEDLQSIHNELADHHAEKAKALRGDAEEAAQEVHRRLADEAVVETERSRTAQEEQRQRYLPTFKQEG